MTESCIRLLDIFTNFSPIRSKSAHCSGGRWQRLFLIGTLSAGAAPFAAAENPGMAMDKMTDEELRAFRDQKIIELRAHRRRFHPEQAAGGTLTSAFFLYDLLTPKESGFTTERGFDATPITAAGLHGRKYPRDSLLAVKKEGFGRINQAVDGQNYIRWTGDSRYAFADAPVGRRGEVLIPRHSCAISSHNKFLYQHTRLRIKSQTVNDETGSDEWFVSDIGPGVHPLQIDLYWGEDEPRGAVGRQRARPRGTWMEYAFEVEVTRRYAECSWIVEVLVPSACCALFGAWYKRRYSSRLCS